MVGDDDAVHTMLAGDARILPVHDALDDEMALPLAPDLGQVRPVQMVAHAEVAGDIACDNRSARSA